MAPILKFAFALARLGFRRERVLPRYSRQLFRDAPEAARSLQILSCRLDCDGDRRALHPPETIWPVEAAALSLGCRGRKHRRKRTGGSGLAQHRHH